MKTTEVNILVWDKPENFHMPETQRQYGGEVLYKAVLQFHSIDTFEEQLKKLGSDELVVVCCHINYTDWSGYLDFKHSNFTELYNIPKVIYLSSANSGRAMQELHEKFSDSEGIILYSQLQKEIKLDTIKPITVASLKNQASQKGDNLQSSDISGTEKFEYALVTALYDDEFEAVKEHFEFPEQLIDSSGRKEIYKGYLKEDSSIKIVAAVATSSGMIDAAVIATHLIERFNPKYLFMTGVCGGSADTKIGDIVVASQFFMFQKGKVSDLMTMVDGKKVPVVLSDSKGNTVEMDNLTDQNGKYVSVALEKFEIEHDTIIEVDSLVGDKIKRKKKDLERMVNDYVSGYREPVTVHIAPIACSTMVINKKGFFEDNIRSVNRKTAAVEMESYAVARACMFGNRGQTKAVVIKSVMDNTTDKIDFAKLTAAKLSALFFKYLLLSKVL